jgi:dsDNA-specific endonuclease/ATPase MutS2
LHEKLEHIKDANDNLNKYWECMMKDREDEKEKLAINKNHKLPKALEALTVPVSAYIHFLKFYISLYS